MIYLIIEYIERTFTVEPRRISKDGRLLFYSDAVSLLEKVFRLDEYEADGYLITYILEIDPDFDYVFWKQSTMLNYMDFSYETVESLEVTLDCVDAMNFAIASQIYNLDE